MTYFYIAKHYRKGITAPGVVACELIPNVGDVITLTFDEKVQGKYEIVGMPDPPGRYNHESKILLVEDYVNMKYYKVLDEDTAQPYDITGFEDQYHPQCGDIITVKRDNISMDVKIVAYNSLPDARVQTEGIIYVSDSLDEVAKEMSKSMASKMTKTIQELPHKKTVILRRCRAGTNPIPNPVSFEIIETRNTIAILPGAYFSLENIKDFMSSHPDVDCYFISWEKI